GAFVLISILMSAYYAIGPWKQHQTWRWVTPGSLTATLGWLVTSWAYSLYLDDVGHASRSYGTFAGVAVLLLWLFATAVTVLLGAELDRDLEASARRGPGVPGAG
ncbi:MAG: YihY/virulence factor BrkB family protein, partial [Acidimicrobiales bacterium]